MDKIMEKIMENMRKPKLALILESNKLVTGEEKWRICLEVNDEIVWIKKISLSEKNLFAQYVTERVRE